MKQIEIIKHYGTKDIKFFGEHSTDLKMDSTIVLSGDTYHSRISDQIDGFLKCLDYLNVEYVINTIKLNDESDWDD
jgi:hypothetical protein